MTYNQEQRLRVLLDSYLRQNFWLPTRQAELIEGVIKRVKEATR